MPGHDPCADPSRIATSGADRIFAPGGVQALAAMAFGIEGIGPVDRIVGPGNAFVAVAPRATPGGLSVAKFLKTLTYHRIDRDSSVSSVRRRACSTAS